jgi:uncharacterized protein YdaU (DUF1376 family)
MAKDPAFLFYPNDYLGGTMGFTLEQHGAYLMLLIYQYNHGKFTHDDAVRIIGNIFESIKHKFDNIDGYICNTRLLHEIEKRKKYCDSRKENISKRYQNAQIDKKTTNIENICNTHVLHMENENENENIDKKEDIKGKEKVHVKHRKQKGFIPPTYDEFYQYCKLYGYECIAERSYRGYVESNWYDSYDNPIKNWKKKLQHVWFRESNKQKPIEKVMTPMSHAKYDPLPQLSDAEIEENRKAAQDIVKKLSDKFTVKL